MKLAPWSIKPSIRLLSLVTALILAALGAYAFRQGGYPNVPQGGQGRVNLSGFDIPRGNQSWDILNPAGSIIATATVPNGWGIPWAVTDGNGVTYAEVSAPSNAVIATGYEVRLGPTSGGGGEPVASNEHLKENIEESDTPIPSSGFFNVIASGPPQAPTGLTATAGNTQILLAWTAPASGPTPTSYNVKRSTTNGGPYTTIATGVTRTNYADSNLTNGTTYYYVVSATNTAGEGPNSNQASATPQGTNPPIPPYGLYAQPGNTVVYLSWFGSSAATSYHVKRSTTNGGPYTTVATVSTLVYTDGGLTNGTTYYYVVTALNSHGESANSNQAKVTPVASSTPLGIVPNPPLGFLPNPLTLPPWEEDTIPTDASGAPEGGPSSLYSVNLAYGVCDVDSGPDIVMDDSYVGTISFGRHYRTAMAAGNLSSPGLPPGWTHDWDYRIVPLQPGSWGPLRIVYPNGASETITPVLSGGNPTGAFNNEVVGAPFVATGVPATGNPGSWTSISLGQNGLEKEFFSMASGDNVYRLQYKEFEDGAQINLTYSSGRLTSLRSSDTGGLIGPTWIYLSYDGSGNLQGATSTGTGGSLNYHYLNGEFSGVDNLVAYGSHMWDYQYTTLGGQPYLNNVITMQGWNATMAYDPATGRAQKMVDANNNFRTYTFSGTTTACQTAVGANGTTQDTWTDATDPNGRVVSETDATGSNTSRVTYADGIDPSAISTVTSPSGQQLTITRDGAGNPTKIAYPFGNYTNLVWLYPSGYPHGQLSQTQDVGSDGTSKAPTVYSYYTTTDPSTGKFAGAVSSVTYPNGGIVAYQYSALGSVTSVATTAADGSPSTTQYIYTTGGQFPQYEMTGKPYQVINPRNWPTNLQYTNSQLWSVASPTATVTATIDAYRQLTNAGLPDGRSLNVAYTNPGKTVSSAAINLGSQQAPLGSAYYDNECSPTNINDATSQSSNQTSNPQFDLKQLNNGNGQVMHTFTPNPFANSSQYSIGNNGGQQTWTQQFNSNGNVSSFTTPIANGTAFPGPGDSVNEVDLAGNQSYNSNLTSKCNYTYDGFGRVKTSTPVTSGEAAFIHKYTYDDEDHVLTDQTWQVSSLISTMTYTYAVDGLRTSMKVNVGAETYTYTYGYDKAGNLTSIVVTDVNGIRVPNVGVTYEYDGDNHVTAARTPLGTMLYQYDANGRVTQLLNLTADNVVDDPTTLYTEQPSGVRHSTYSSFTNIGYDLLDHRTGMNFMIRGYFNNQTSVKYTSGSAVFGYGSSLSSETWSASGLPTVINNYLDDGGQNLTTSRSLNFPVDPTSDELNTTFQNPSAYPDIAWDPGGNMTGGRGLQITWDVAGRPSKIYWPSAPASGDLDGYDGSGLRISRGLDETFAYDGSELAHNSVPASQQDTFYVWGPTGPIQEFQGGGAAPATYNFDPNGSTIYRIAYFGPEAGPHLYDAYGQPVWPQLVEAGYPGENLSYQGLILRYKGQAGYVTDTDTDVIYCWHRFYDPVAGRWMSKDPAGLDGGINTYCYCEGNPLTMFDPSGLDGVTIFGFEFSLNVVGHGLATSAAALGHSASCGLWDGGPYKNEPGFDGSSICWDIAGITGMPQKGVAFLSAKLFRGVACGTAAARSYLAAKRIQSLVRRAESAASLTENQVRALRSSPWLRRAFWGERVHTELSALVSEDRMLKALGVRVTPRFTTGPDFFFSGNKAWFDLTTPKAWDAHLFRYAGWGRGNQIFYGR